MQLEVGVQMMWPSSGITGKGWKSHSARARSWQPSWWVDVPLNLESKQVCLWEGGWDGVGLPAALSTLRRFVLLGEMCQLVEVAAEFGPPSARNWSLDFCFMSVRFFSSLIFVPFSQRSFFFWEVHSFRLVMKDLVIASLVANPAAFVMDSCSAVSTLVMQQILICSTCPDFMAWCSKKGNTYILPPGNGLMINSCQNQVILSTGRLFRRSAAKWMVTLRQPC